MNILLLANHLNTGGIASYILTLARGLKEQGHGVYVMTSGGNVVESLQKDGIEHGDLGFRTKSEIDPRIYFAIPRIVSFVRAHNINVIHAQTRVTQVLSYFVSQQAGIPFVSTCHGFFKPRFFRRLFPCWGERVIAISGPVREHLLADFQVDPLNVTLIPNGIDLSQFKILPQDAKDALRADMKIKGGPVIGIIARLSDVKGHIYLVKAFQEILVKYPSARLLIVGEGPEENNISAAVRELGLSAHVDFHKIVNRTADILPLFDVFVMPSIQEGLGLSVLEAQAAGLPVVASRVGGLPDIVEHNRTGLLVEPRDFKAIAEGIAALLEHPAKAWDMGRMARMFVEKNFGAARMVQETIELYESVCK